MPRLVTENLPGALLSRMSCSWFGQWCATPEVWPTAVMESPTQPTFRALAGAGFWRQTTSVGLPEATSAAVSGRDGCARTQSPPGG